MDSTSQDGTVVSEWPTPAGFVRRGMRVIAPGGEDLGRVVGVEGEELLLDGGNAEFVAVSQIDGVSKDTVLLSGRGDATFGLGAQP